MSFTREIARNYSKRGKTTYKVDSVAQMGNVIKVVAGFNTRNPTSADIDTMVASTFTGRMSPVEHSFRVVKQGFRTVVAGFVTPLQATRPMAETAGMKEVARNVWMDSEDNQIWMVDGDRIVRAGKEDLAEIAKLAQPRETTSNFGRAEIASIKVEDFAGPRNTQLVAYVDCETAKVVAGVRVSDTHVYSETAGAVEVAEDQVVVTQMLNGADYVESAAEQAGVETATVTTEQMIEYYRKLYSFDPAYFDLVVKNLLARALA